MGNLFSTKTSNTTNSNESGTANTANNLWNDPGVQSFFQQYQNQYSPSNIASVQAPVNSYETNAANAQAGAAAPAAGIANNGITSASIQQYMSPYIQSVVNPTLQAQNIQNQQGLSNLGGNAALRGALGNNTGSGAAYLAGVQPAQEATIAGLYNQGYGQAENTAAQSAQTQLAGVNAATGANTAAFNQGQGIQQTNLQNQLLPFSLTDQAGTGLQNYGNLAGTDTTSTGTSSGTSTGTTTPGLGTVAAGLIGAALSGGKLSDERIKDNIKPIGSTFDGQPIYKYNLKGSPQTEIGLMAQDVERRDPGAVGSFGGIKSVDYDRATKGAERANGGSVGGEDEFHGKVMKAFHMIQGMKAHARGGMVHRDMGGDVGMGSWAPVVTPSSDDGPSTSQQIGSGLTDFSKKMSAAPQGDGGLGKQQQALAQMLSSAASSTMPRPMRPYGGGVPALGTGGSPDDYSGDPGLAGGQSGPAMSPYDLQSTPASRALGSAWDWFKKTGKADAAPDPSGIAPINRTGVGRMSSPGDMPGSGDDPGMFAPTVQFGDTNAQSPMAQSPMAMAGTPDAPPAREILPWKVGASDVPPPSAAPAASAPAAKGSSWRDYLPSIASDGVWAGEQATPMQRFGAALTQIGDRNPFAGYGQAIMSQQRQRLEDMKGTPTVSLLQSEALKAAHDADLNYQINSSNQLAAAKNQQEIKRLQGLKAFSKRTGTPLDNVVRMTAAPPGPPPVPGAEWYPAYGGWHVPDPDRPGKYLKVNPD